MKKKRILWGLLIVCCILFVRPIESKADNAYTINISKTSPATVEKKLRKMKASSTQRVELMIDVTGEKGYKKDYKTVDFGNGLKMGVLQQDIVEANEKIAQKKLEQWLKKFQKLKANTYGVLPIAYSLNSNLYHVSSGLYRAGGCASDYVNLKTIFDKAYNATEGKCEYRGNYFNKIVTKEKYSYPGTYNGGERIYVDETTGINDVTEMLKDVPVKQYTKTALKKQSDSVRVQVLLYGVSKAKLFTMSDDLTKKTKDSLYDLARGKAVMCSGHSFSNSEHAYTTWSYIAHRLSMDIDVFGYKPYGGSLNDPTFGSIKAKNSNGGWDYFEIYDTTIQPQNIYSDTYSYLSNKPSARKEARGKGVYNWITKGKATEADSFYLKKAVKLFKDGTYIDYLMEHGGYAPTDEPIKLKLVNQNKTKYGFTSASYTLNVYKDENQQTAWDWVLNK